MFKGVIHTDDPTALELITRKNRVTGTEMAPEQYIKLVSHGWLHQPLVVQNVVRGMTAALLCHTNEHYSEKGRMQLIAVEGCRHVVGGKPMSGGQIMESIWAHAMPPDVMDQIASPIIEHTSRCSVQEIRAVLRHLDADGCLDAITHAYHVPRTQQILDEEKLPSQTVEAYDPLRAVASGRFFHPSHRFIADIYHAWEVHRPHVLESHAREEKGEAQIQLPLHTVSRRVERLTGGILNIETLMARVLRKGYSPRKTAS
jgi:hypothetical protein